MTLSNFLNCCNLVGVLEPISGTGDEKQHASIEKKLIEINSILVELAEASHSDVNAVSSLVRNLYYLQNKYGNSEHFLKVWQNPEQIYKLLDSLINDSDDSSLGRIFKLVQEISATDHSYLLRLLSVDSTDKNEEGGQGYDDHTVGSCKYALIIVYTLLGTSNAHQSGKLNQIIGSKIFHNHGAGARLL